MIKDIIEKIKHDAVDIDDEEKIWEYCLEYGGPFDRELPDDINPVEELFIDVMQTLHEEE